MKTTKIKKAAIALLCSAMLITSSVAVTSVNAATVATVEVEASTLSLNVKSLNLGKGETYKLTANKSASFKSSKTSVATVDKNGKITAKSSGTATITATSGKQTATCKVTVKKAPKSISLNKTSMTLGVGETFDLNSSLPAGTASRSVKYTSSNSKVASVKAAGGLTTAKSVGTATITATTFNGKKATCKVTVKKAPASISLNKTSLTLGVGETFDLDSKLPSGTASRSIVYTSSNNKVAFVKAAGGLTTAKSVGTATLTATTFNGKKATCKVTVKKAPDSVSLNKTELTLGVSETFDLNSKLPAGTASRVVSYKSSNPSVATVKTAGGLVTAKAKGTATITATTFNGKTATCTVTVPGTWHEAEYKTVTEKVKVVDEEGYTYEKPIYTNDSLCGGCMDKANELTDYDIWDLDDEYYYLACRGVGINPSLTEIALTDLGYNPDDYTIEERNQLYRSLIKDDREKVEEAEAAHKHKHIENKERSGYFDRTFIVGYETVTVPEQYHYETVTEKVLVREAGYY